MNDTIRNIKKHSNIDEFLRKYHFKGSGPGGDFNGPTIKGLINNDHKLNELKAEIGPENISEVHRVATRTRATSYNISSRSKKFDLEDKTFILQFI